MYPQEALKKSDLFYGHRHVIKQIVDALVIRRVDIERKLVVFVIVDAVRNLKGELQRLPVVVGRKLADLLRMVVFSVRIGKACVEEDLRGKIGFSGTVGENFEIHRHFIGLAGRPNHALTRIVVTGNRHVLVDIRVFLFIPYDGDDRIARLVEERGVFGVFGIAADKLKAACQLFGKLFLFLRFEVGVLDDADVIDGICAACA